jgi:hypothetical protein
MDKYGSDSKYSRTAGSAGPSADQRRQVQEYLQMQQAQLIQAIVECGVCNLLIN